MNTHILRPLLLSVISLFLWSSCGRDNPSILFPEPSLPEETASPTELVNQFVVDCMDTWYLWNNKLPDVDVKAEKDPYALFEKLVYQDDKWSFLTEDVKGLNSTLAGSGKSFGYSLTFYKINNTKNYVGVVEYVYAGLPAAAAGMKRGDIILKIDGKSINEDNYRDLYYADALILEMGEIKNGTLTEQERTLQLISATTYQDPVLEARVLEEGNARIGYLAYTGYTLASHKRLQEVLLQFQQEGITDLVLDLRYNSGGYSITSKYLCSMLVPRYALDEHRVYMREFWNSDVMAYYKEKGIDTREYYVEKALSSSGEVLYQVNVNLDLTRIYVLTGRGTASASEATIVGLSPYMDVIRIGEKTSGKYCGGIVFDSEILYGKEISSIKDWGLYCMVYRFNNNDDTADFVSGFEPHHSVVEDIIADSTPLGNVQEPLLAAAIALITGKTPASAQGVTRSSSAGLTPVEHPVKGYMIREGLPEKRF